MSRESLFRGKAGGFLALHSSDGTGTGPFARRSLRGNFFPISDICRQGWRFPGVGLERRHRYRAARAAQLPAARGAGAAAGGGHRIPARAHAGGHLLRTARWVTCQISVDPSLSKVHTLPVTCTAQPPNAVWPWRTLISIRAASMPLTFSQLAVRGAETQRQEARQLCLLLSGADCRSSSALPLVCALRAA